MSEQMRAAVFGLRSSHWAALLLEHGCNCVHIAETGLSSVVLFLSLSGLCLE